MEFKRFKRKGLIYNNNSIGLGLEIKNKKKMKVFRIERLKAGNNLFDYLVYDGLSLVKTSLKKEIVKFLEINEKSYSFFEGQTKIWISIS